LALRRKVLRVSPTFHIPLAIVSVTPCNAVQS
jgi:hypothetical protein